MTLIFGIPKSRSWEVPTRHMFLETLLDVASKGIASRGRGDMVVRDWPALSSPCPTLLCHPCKTAERDRPPPGQDFVEQAL